MKKSMFNFRCAAAFFYLITLLTITIYAQSTLDLMSQANGFLANGANDRALSLYSKILSRNPTDLEAIFNSGTAYFNKGSYSNAAKMFKRAASLDPNNSNTWTNLASAYQNLGQTNLAISALSKSINQNPQDMQARLNLAFIFQGQNRYSNAIKQYEIVVRNTQDSPESFLNLATCLKLTKKYDKSLFYLKEAQKLFPNNAVFFFEAASILDFHLKHYQEAAPMYQHALALSPDNPVFYQQYADLLLKQKQKDKAISILQNAIPLIGDILEREKIQRRINVLTSGNSDDETPYYTSKGISDLEINKRSDLALKENADAKRITIDSTAVHTNIDFMDQTSQPATSEFLFGKALLESRKPGKKSDTLNTTEQ